MFKTLYSRIAIYTITVIIFSALVSFFIANIYYHFNLKENNDTKIMRTLKEARTYEHQLPSKYVKSYFQHLGQINYQIVTVDKQGQKHFMVNLLEKIHCPHHLLTKLCVVMIITV